jgi:uncharacterized protein YbbC (DUF1343 family)
MRRILSVLVIFTIVFTVIGCTGDPKEPTSNNQDVGNEMNHFDGEYISFDYSDQWTVEEDTKYHTISAKKESSKLYVLIELEKGVDQDDETSVTNFSQNYGGTPTELVTYSAINFYQTSFVHGDVEQTMMVNTKDQNKLVITLQGNGHADDEGIKEILNSLVLKY